MPANLVVSGGEVADHVEPDLAATRQKEPPGCTQSLGMLAGKIAHDFNNLLVGIVGNTDLLLNGYERDPTELLRLIKVAAMNASNLTRQLLVYAGQERSMMRVARLPDIVIDSLALIEFARPRDVKIQTKIPDDLAPLDADHVQVQQILLNLLRNAIDAIQGKGLITVQAFMAPLTQSCLKHCQHARTAVPGEFVVLQIRDTGAGMDAQQIERIFEPFYTTKFNGRGLGLASVLGIVENHRGAIKVQSWPGQGTLFEIAFPVSTSCYRDRAVEEEDDTWQGSGPVLLVEDDDDVRNVMTGFLSLLGFQVTAVRNGTEGLAAYDGANPMFELVVMDWMMPGMPGERVLELLRARRDDLPVVVVSGLHAENLALGMDRVARVQKPMTFAVLRAAARSVIERQTS